MSIPDFFMFFVNPFVVIAVIIVILNLLFGGERVEED